MPRYPHHYSLNLDDAMFEWVISRGPDYMRHLIQQTINYELTLRDYGIEEMTVNILKLQSRLKSQTSELESLHRDLDFWKNKSRKHLTTD